MEREVITAYVEESYIIGTSLYYLDVSCALFNDDRHLSAIAYYCWCLFKQVRFADQQVTVKVSELIQGVLIARDASGAQQVHTIPNLVVANRIEEYCLDTTGEGFRYPDNALFLYGLVHHQDDILLRWALANRILSMFHVSLSEDVEFASSLSRGINNYIYYLLSGVLDVGPMVLAYIPSNNREYSSLDLASEADGAAEPTISQYGLPTPPPSP